ncbi:MAG TPA: tetratricopeptide repeat protein, partial [Pirellulaceae bacterium]|nr:tetratricopeptide repeat protein [Pirellulaceae bacterium]
MRHDFEQMRRSDGGQAAADAALWNNPDAADALQFAGECFASQPATAPALLHPLAALCFRRAAESDRSRVADVLPRIEAVQAAARHAAKRLAEQGVTPPEAESSNRSSRASAEIRAPGANSSATRGSAAASRELTPESIARLQALFESGNQQAALGRHAEAEQAFRQVVEAAPAIAVAHFNLANACFAQGKFGDAAEAYFHCLGNTDVAPDDWQLAANAWNNLGNLRTQQASPRQAWDAFSSAVACDPTLASAWWNLGRLAADDGAAGIARLCFTESIRLSPPRRIEPRLSLAKLLLDAGRADAALAAYDEILAAAPNAAPALKGRAFALLKAGRVTEAVHDCLQVIQATPDDADAFSLLARANRARGQLTEAQFCDLKSLELAPRSPGVRSHFLDLRQFDPAATLDEFLDLTTHWNDVH